MKLAGELRLMELVALDGIPKKENEKHKITTGMFGWDRFGLMDLDLRV